MCMWRACGVRVACVWRAYGVRVRVCAVFVRACETVLEGGGGGVETGYVGNNTKHKKCHMI